ncbi:threonylcarbamoyl-AMP synthase [Candidatus Micrarchaeota archaeon]|nr:threonylcarbamoyl-AMP synthase [Candidatus Micrarchaeota archaeon]
MQTKILKLEHDMEKMAKVIDQCVNVISKGGIFTFPTETSYGIGCDATNEKAIKRIYETKERSAYKPLPIIVSDERMAEEYFELNENARKLIKAFMPGPLSLVLNKKGGKLSDEFWPKEIGVAFRISSKEFTRLIAQEAGVPLVATSANLSGKTPIYRFDEIKSTFNGNVELMVDGGNLPPIRPSTIIDMRDKMPIVVREGPLQAQDVLHELARE